MNSQPPEDPAPPTTDTVAAPEYPWTPAAYPDLSPYPMVAPYPEMPSDALPATEPSEPEPVPSPVDMAAPTYQPVPPYARDLSYRPSTPTYRLAPLPPRDSSYVPGTPFVPDPSYAPHGPNLPGRAALMAWRLRRVRAQHGYGQRRPPGQPWMRPRSRRRWPTISPASIAILFPLLLVAAAITLVIHAVSNPTHDHGAHDSGGLSSNTSCSTMSGRSVGLGVQVVNTSSHTLTLTGATIRGLPADLLSTGTYSWTGCDSPDNVASGTSRLAPHASQWVMVSLSLTTACPDDASPTITVDYTDNSAARTASFPFGDLSDGMPCPQPTA